MKILLPEETSRRQRLRTLRRFCVKRACKALIRRRILDEVKAEEEAERQAETKRLDAPLWGNRTEAAPSNLEQTKPGTQPAPIRPQLSRQRSLTVQLVEERLGVEAAEQLATIFSFNHRMIKPLDEEDDPSENELETETLLVDSDENIV